MTAVTLTADSHDDVVADGTTIVRYTAPWCGPCKVFGPIFEEVAGRHPDVTFATVDIDEQPDLATRANIMSVPTLVAFRDGTPVATHRGTMPAGALDQLVADHV